MGTRPRSVVWTRIGSDGEPLPGLEHVRLGERAAASTLVALGDDGDPFTLRYRIGWDDAWRLREARFTVQTAAGQRGLLLTADGEGRWRDEDDQDVGDLEGCLDIDVWPTPFTNTFPVRRLRLVDGARADIDIVYIAAPGLTVARRPQAYTRTGARTYLFESLDDGFRTEVSFDEDGLVVDYPGLFRRVE